MKNNLEKLFYFCILVTVIFISVSYTVHLDTLNKKTQSEMQWFIKQTEYTQMQIDAQKQLNEYQEKINSEESTEDSCNH
jgi:hypothetical protein